MAAKKYIQKKRNQIYDCAYVTPEGLEPSTH